MLDTSREKKDELISDFLLRTPTYWHSSVISLVSREFGNGPGDWGSIPGWDTPKTQKMVLYISLLNTQHYKECIKGNVE